MKLWPFSEPGKTGAQKLAQKQLDDARKYALLYRASAEEALAFAKMYEERAERLQKTLDAQNATTSTLRHGLEQIGQVLDGA